MSDITVVDVVVVLAVYEGLAAVLRQIFKKIFCSEWFMDREARIHVWQREYEEHHRK